MEDRQLQHQNNVNSRQPYDYSSGERTLFQYIQHYSGELDHSLVQKQHERQQ